MADAPRGFLRVPHALLRSEIEPTLLRVYLVIASFADAGKSNECTARRETIAAASGCSPASAKRAISALRDVGWIKVVQRAGQSSVITPVKPADLDWATIGDQVGSHRPGVGSHRPGGRVTVIHKEDGMKKTEEEDYGKPTRAASGRATEAQFKFLDDIAGMLIASGYNEEDLDDQIGSVVTRDAADLLIKELWCEVEHVGRTEVADSLLRDPEAHRKVSPRALEWLRNEHLPESLWVAS